MKKSIKVAKNSGFCFGVRRAIEIAEKTVKPNKKIFSLGPLIHNPQEVKRLENIGIKKIENTKSLKNKVLILRTHGIPHGLKEKLKIQNLVIVDATCPFVKRAQDIVEKLAKAKKKILIVGEKKHPEIKALVSYGGSHCYVVEQSSDLKNLDLSGDICVVSQTTQSPQNFKNFVSIIKKINPQAAIYNTICKATIDRQTAAKELSKKVDVMVVVGGKNSGNTKRLAQICSKFTKTYYVETALEIKPQWFKKTKNIGISAGASTPDWIIKEVRKKIEENVNKQGAGNG
ncbi:MAG: 4-hydroxy-3-methylbut-2-enyl diphosphate reductase [Elusimicrobia bacterium]|nr:4-hydroxy-3-methylbut-2-enyl diphosphate reductase [Elusimicrobiota bacterium]